MELELIGVEIVSLHIFFTIRLNAHQAGHHPLKNESRELEI